MSIEADSFTHRSSLCDGGPRLVLMRQLDNKGGRMLYELTPEDLADGRQKRFTKINNNPKFARVAVTEVVPDVGKDPDNIHELNRSVAKILPVLLTVHV